MRRRKITGSFRIRCSQADGDMFIDPSKSYRILLKRICKSVTIVFIIRRNGFQALVPQLSHVDIAITPVV